MKDKVISGSWKSVLVLVLSNTITIIIAVMEGWNLSKVMWIYWAQSVVIGYFNWRRIRCLKEFSVDGFKINDQPVSATKITQRQVANIFAIHYGFFHVGYCVFLVIEKADLSQIEMFGAVTCLVTFIANHWFSFKQNIDKFVRRKPNIGTVMLFPYARILPMHLTIMVGSYLEEQTTGTLILFMSLKSLADLMMHMAEHRGDANQQKTNHDAGHDAG